MSRLETGGTGNKRDQVSGVIKKLLGEMIRIRSILGMKWKLSSIETPWDLPD